jgi:putative ABC transport system ATP-binding protein
VDRKIESPWLQLEEIDLAPAAHCLQQFRRGAGQEGNGAHGSFAGNVADRLHAPSLVGFNLIQSFGIGDKKTFALKGVSIDLYPGEVTLLMGPSGSGKSTLLAVLSGLLRPNSGSVRADGHDLSSMSETELEQFRLKHCSYIFQGSNLFPALSAREQLEIVLRWGEGASTQEARDRAERMLNQLGLAGKTRLRPNELSGGERQRVAIGRALVKHPTYVFADEPTASLDWENGRQVVLMLAESAWSRGATVLIVTHDPRLREFADRVIDLADGRIRAPGEDRDPNIKRGPDPQLRLQDQPNENGTPHIELIHASHGVAATAKVRFPLITVRETKTVSAQT